MVVVATPIAKPSYKNNGRICLTEGCNHSSSNNKYCGICRMPACCKKCRECGVTALHYAGTMKCRACVIWKEMNRSQHARRTPKEVCITKEEYDKLLANATICEDTGHVFAAGGETDSALQKSLDRIDNIKGYELGNIRVVTALANLARGNVPIEAWRLAAAYMTEHNCWPEYRYGGRN